MPDEQPLEPWQAPPTSTFPPPLDLSVTPDGQPFMIRFGPAFQWMNGKLLCLFAVPGGPVMWRELEPVESARLLEWMLKSATGSTGG